MHPLVKLVVLVVLVGVAVVVWGRVMGRKDPDRELVGLTDTVRARVSREISAGHKLNAIKIYREATGARSPTQSAPSTVGSSRVVARACVTRAASYTDGRLTDEARARISELILAGRREDAMSLYAEATGASDSEARAIIRTWDTAQNY